MLLESFAFLFCWIAYLFARALVVALVSVSLLRYASLRVGTIWRVLILKNNKTLIICFSSKFLAVFHLFFPI